jgi:hypothetical protein
LTETACTWAVFVSLGSGENATLSQVFVTERPWRVDLSGQGGSVV